MTDTVLIVGGSGPVGRAIAGELGKNGHGVLAVSRGGEHRLDFTDRDAARAVLQASRPSTVIHLARPAAGGSDADDVAEFAAQCADLGVRRFAFASSAAVYGTKTRDPHAEGDPVDTQSPYARLKLESEAALADVAAHSALTVMSLRIFNVYGPGFDDSLVNRLVLDHNPEVYLTDTFLRDYVHSADVARAFRFAVEAPDTPPIVNVGTGIGTGNSTLLALIPGVRHRAIDGEGIRSFSVADISLMERTWGFVPAIRLSDAVLYPELEERGSGGSAPWGVRPQ